MKAPAQVRQAGKRVQAGRCVQAGKHAQAGEAACDGPSCLEPGRRETWEAGTKQKHVFPTGLCAYTGVHKRTQAYTGVHKRGAKRLRRLVGKTITVLSADLTWARRVRGGGLLCQSADQLPSPSGPGGRSSVEGIVFGRASLNGRRPAGPSLTPHGGCPRKQLWLLRSSLD